MKRHPSEEEAVTKTFTKSKSVKAPSATKLEVNRLQVTRPIVANTVFGSSLYEISDSAAHLRARVCARACACVRARDVEGMECS